MSNLLSDSVLDRKNLQKVCTEISSPHFMLCRQYPVLIQKTSKEAF